MVEDEVRQTIIGLAFKVHKHLGAGFVESVQVKRKFRDYKKSENNPVQS